MPLEEDEDVRCQVVSRLASHLSANFDDINQAYLELPKNVRVVLRRHEYAAICQDDDRPVCTFIDQSEFMRALVRHPWKKVLFTLARLYDEAHIALYRASKSGKSRFEALKDCKKISLRECGKTLQNRSEAVDDQILIEHVGYGDAMYKAVFREIAPMSFDKLDRLDSLTEILPGEKRDSQPERYAGIGGGGGSDIISASILGVLLGSHKQEKRMDILVSTRTWATGSQGKKGAKIGTQREVHHHSGQVERLEKDANGDEQRVTVGGTYRINANTSAEGRHLESIPLKIPEPHHKDVFLVLDQGESLDVPEKERAKLEDQLRAILELEPGRVHTILNVDSGGSAFGSKNLDTIISVDTGGDVFGVDSTGGTTPDQDYRVQKALFEMNEKWSNKHNLVTAVVAPGVDAPRDAPIKAQKAGGKRYVLKQSDKEIILRLLKEYEMDGSNPDRFGKTTLALQARLNGALGWTSLDLPEYVIDTWENPWNSFVYIRECMSDIILMPTQSLLKLIAPKQDSPKQEAQKNGGRSPRLRPRSPKGTHATINGTTKDRSPARSPDLCQTRIGLG